MKNKKSVKKQMHKDTFDPRKKSKYASKKSKQAKGVYSKRSPFYTGEE
tara:strand:+ start:161 stop:304 length:144 start_codon:yes stop_codon:yes gene_type:complete